MIKVNLTILALLSSTIVACGGPQDDLSLDQPSGVEGTAFGCFDAPGWDVCSYSAQHIFENMQFDGEERGFDGPFHDGIRRTGSWNGQELNCTQLINIDLGEVVDGYSCGESVARDLEAIYLYIEMWNHADVEHLGSTERQEFRDWESGQPTGDTFIGNPLRIGGYTCQGRLAFHGVSNSIDVDGSNLNCSVSIR